MILSSDRLIKHSTNVIGLKKSAIPMIVKERVNLTGKKIILVGANFDGPSLQINDWVVQPI